MSEARRRGDVLIATSDSSLRKGLVQHLRGEASVRLSGHASDREGLEQSLLELAPSVLILDLPLQGYEGLESLGRVKALSPATRTILLADSKDHSRAVAALKEGAWGYCPRNTNPFLVRRAVQLVLAGELWIGRKLMLQLVEDLAAAQRAALDEDDERLRRLTGREHEIIQLITTGASNKEIASRLFIAEKTVKTHLTNIFGKTGLPSRLELAVCALRSRATTKGAHDVSSLAATKVLET